MLRELVNACERLTSDAQLVLAFEDLQWIDPSTMDLIEVLALTRAPMQLVLIGTYRPADLTSGDYRLRALGPDIGFSRLIG